MKNTIAISLLLASVALQPMNSSFGAEMPPAGAKTFIDYFRPMPSRGALSKDVWGAPEVGLRDIKNGLEDVTVNHWHKLERPGVLLENGHVTAVTVAVLDIPKEQQKGNDAHGSKILVIPFDGAALDRDLQNVDALPAK